MRFEGLSGATWLWPTVAFATTVALMRALAPLADRLGLVDHPTERKDHHAVTPATGGLAMLLGMATALWAGASAEPAVRAFLCAGALLVATGWVDDRKDLRWWLRIAIQVVTALLLIGVGGVRIEHLGPVFGFGGASLGALSLPVTVFATVGIINAMNMIDGVDGLAGSLTLATLLMVVAAAGYSGNAPLVRDALTLSGAVVGFLLFNFRFPGRARALAFMGNSGSALLGLAIAWTTFRLTQNAGHPVSPVLAIWLAPVAVVDCLVLIVRRRQQGRSPFSADHNHIHHIMRDAGFAPMGTAIGLMVFSFIAGLAIGQCLRWDVPEPLLAAAFVAVLFGWFVLTARRERAVRWFRRARFWARS